MSFSRAHPSARYVELQCLYRSMHEEGEQFLGVPAKETFPGKSLLPQADAIKRLIERRERSRYSIMAAARENSTSPALSGTTQAQFGRGSSITGISMKSCATTPVAPFSNLPEGKFDGVISTDVLEHCPADDIPWIVAEMFGFAARFVFASVACYPAAKRLPNGENAHCTIRPSAWWTELFKDIAARHPGVIWELRVYSKDGKNDYVGRDIITS